MTEAVRGERSEPWGCVWTEQGQGPGEVGGCACSGTKKGPVWSESREGGGGEGNKLREISRGRCWEMLWDVSFTPMGDVHPRRHSGTESFWAAISEALRKEGIVPGNTAPQAGSCQGVLHPRETSTLQSMLFPAGAELDSMGPELY